MEKETIHHIYSFIEALENTKKEISEHSNFDYAESDLVALTAISKDFTENLFNILEKHGEEEKEHYETTVRKIRQMDFLLNL